MNRFFIFTLLATLSLSSCAFRSAIDEVGNIRTRTSSPSALRYGEKAFEDYKEKQSISSNPKFLNALKRVSIRLKEAIDMPEADWEFVVFRDNSANAFALPGGKVAVNTGLFKLIADDDPERSDAFLAAVLGHEISHATAGHIEYRMYRALATSALAAALWYGLDQSGEDHPALGIGAFVIGSYLLDGLPLSRWQEYESDKIGAIYMAKAGYDPRESIELWHRLERYHSLSEQQKPAFLRTHPTDQKRITELEKFMPIALRYYRSVKHEQVIIGEK